jgi:hypothetical protein
MLPWYSIVPKSLIFKKTIRTRNICNELESSIIYTSSFSRTYQGLKGNDIDMHDAGDIYHVRLYVRLTKFACLIIMFIKEGKNIYKTTSHVESVHLIRTAL